MLRLYQLWHGIPTDTYSAINNDDLNVAAQFQILYPYGGSGWNKLITPQNYICTTYPSTGEILFLPMSTYQHPRYLTTLRVYENAGQPLPLYSPVMYDSVDLYLTSDYAVFNNNVQIAFIDQLGLNDMNLEALHFKKNHWLLLDNAKSSYWEAINFASKARATGLPIDFVRVDCNGQICETLTIPQLIESSGFSLFELPNNLRSQQIGMINLFRELKSDMFLSPVLLHGGYTKIMCDSTDTIFQVMGIVVRSLTEGKAEVSDWLKITQSVDTLFLINHEYRKLIAKNAAKVKISIFLLMTLPVSEARKTKSSKRSSGRICQKLQ